MVEGQIHGGVLQGFGQCFMENAQFDETGQLLTGSFMDYAIPHFTDSAPMPWQSHRCRRPPTRSVRRAAARRARRVDDLGDERGGGRATGRGINHFDMPASPPRVEGDSGVGAGPARNPKRGQSRFSCGYAVHRASSMLRRALGCSICSSAIR